MNSANFKKLLSTIIAGSAGYVVPLLAHAIAGSPTLGPVLSAVLALLVAVGHLIPAFGTKEAVITSMLSGKDSKTVEKVLDKEGVKP